MDISKSVPVILESSICVPCLTVCAVRLNIQSPSITINCQYLNGAVAVGELEVDERRQVWSKLWSAPSSARGDSEARAGLRGHILAIYGCGKWKKDSMSRVRQTIEYLDRITSHTNHIHVDQSKAHLGRYISWRLGHYCFCACGAKDRESCMDSISTMFRVQSC